MRRGDLLADFVREALTVGQSRDRIGAALADAGWTPAEIRGALAAYAETDFIPPVPRPRPFVSARDAFFYGLLLVALAMSAWHLVALMFRVIDLWLPEGGEADFAMYAIRSIRWSIASLLVFFPLFLGLDLRASRALARDPGRRRSEPRKWFVFITLFVAAISLAGDLVYVIYALLDGELTLRVMLKVLTVAVVAAAVFAYFLREVREDRDAP